MLKNLSTVIIIGMSILNPFVGYTETVVTEERSEKQVSSKNFLDEANESFFKEENDVELKETKTSEATEDCLPIIPVEEVFEVNEESKVETEISENKTTTESSSPEETEDGQKKLKNAELVTHTWGSVSWTWDAATKTIELESGEAGTVAAAPWKQYPSVVKIIFKDKVVFPSDSSEMFRWLQDLEIIENGGNIDVSSVTNMNSMFSSATSLTELDVSNWDVSNVTGMNSMFSTTHSLTRLDVSNWNVSSVTDMSSMFSFANSLTELNVSNWDVSSVTKMSYMFGNPSSIMPATGKIKKLDVSKWDVSSVTDMSGMFYKADALSELDVSKWDVSSVTDMSYIFSEVSSLSELDISSFNMQNVAKMVNFFSGTKLEKLTLGSENKFSADAGLGIPYLSADMPAEKWIRVNGTNAVTSTELMNNYGSGDLITGTYVAEREQLSINHFDPVTVSIGDEVSMSFNLDLNLYPTTKEKGSIFNINYVLPSKRLVEYDSNAKVSILDSNEQITGTVSFPINEQDSGFNLALQLSPDQLSAAKSIKVVVSGTAWNNTSGLNLASLEVKHPTWGGEDVEIDPLTHQVDHDFEITNGCIEIEKVPDQLDFDVKNLSNTLNGTLIDLKTNNFGISILDYRGTNAISQTDKSAARQDWELFLTAEDFIDQKNNIISPDTLSLVYVKDGQNHEILSSDEVKIESHSVQGETAKDNHLHELLWKGEEGLKVHVKNINNLEANQTYQSTVAFELRQAP